MRRTALALSILAILLAPAVTSASPILSASAGTFAGAQVLGAGSFSLNALANVQDSTTIPHVEISQNGRPSAGFDFYTFTTAGGTTHLDIDDQTAGADFDTQIGIWDSAGILIATNDDNSSDAGDNTDIFNSRVNNLNLAAGTYVVGVSAFFSTYQNGAPFITGAQVPQGGGYTFNISTAPATTSAVPEPFTLSLLGLGIGALGARGYRRSRS
jgi:hypothetical protein